MTRSAGHMRPTVAFVLAAGLGIRMRPLTDDIPKPMVRLAGRPIIAHVLDRLAAAGITRAVVNVHYKPAALLAHLGQRESPAVTISDETDLLLETGGGVKRALPLIGADPFLIHNSDTVWLEPHGGANLLRLIAAWDPERMDGLLLLARRDGSLGYDGAGDFSLDEHNRLARRGTAASTPYVFAGVSIAHPRLLDGSPDGPFSLNQPWDAAIARGKLHGLVMDGLWMHIGTPEALAAAEAEIARRPEWTVS